MLPPDFYSHLLIRLGQLFNISNVIWQNLNGKNLYYKLKISREFDMYTKLLNYSYHILNEYKTML